MQSRYIYFVNLFLIYFKWFQIYSIERTKRTSIYSTQEVVILSRKPETHFIVLVCWLCDLIYKILSSFTETIFSPPLLFNNVPIPQAPLPPQDVIPPDDPFAQPAPVHFNGHQFHHLPPELAQGLQNL